MSPSLEKVMRGFRPIFGLEEDKHIVKRYGKIIKLLGEIDSVAMRKLIREGKSEQMSSKMKEVRDMEKQLVKSVNERNIL